jgi:putative oxidoreductase
VDIALWIAQVLLALVLVAFGFTHATQRDPSNDPRMAWMHAVPKPLMTTIGILELLAAVGLVVPGLTRILPWLTPLAAWLFALLMVFAIVFHARRLGEMPNIALNVILLAVALFIAIGRTFVAPL